ncbi:TonB-dependent receptor [Pseudoxanthomonas broegbernensis]|uniref:TonB-dependent receptor n=1 Tax=Pseudoxanthomonas broegbernensis TaxID=83619 RepID=A0A7V8GNY5_9GAMM|nr:TonB-dependent receptor [Pseudoxanthomonas broegbernensis]KAF1687393.1 TonB-dependent receptor [Pseudoxanthomonas broegbernensis]MBB6065777.1 iron complex outermembrane receptor protein [Pseudoxanthomonas broegbernensis]
MRFASPAACASRLALAIALAAIPAAAVAADATADPTTLDAVQVRAAGIGSLKAERARTPGHVAVIDAEDFRERTVTHMADALRYVPGVWTESGTGGDAIFISSRGSNLDATGYDSNGIKLFQDGLPVTTADGNNHNRFLDPAAARYAVVALGANALTYGASTLGGAIDFISPTARNGVPDEIAFTAGSHGLVAGRTAVGGVSGGIDGRITLEGKRRDGYREHGRQERRGAHANLGWQVSEGFGLRFFAAHVDNDEELAGPLTRAQFDADPYQAQPSAITGNFQLNVRSSRLAAKGAWDIDGRSRLEFGVSWEDQRLYHPIVDKVMVDFDGPGPLQPVEVFSLLREADQRTWGGMVRYSIRLGDHDVLAGANLADTREKGGNFRNDGGRRNGRTALTDKRSDSVEAFVVDRWRFAPDWTLVYGAQGVLTGRDVRSTDVASGARVNARADYTSFNPRLGVVRALTPSSELFASASRLYEAPTTFELEDDVRGSGVLDAMHGTVIEMGLRGGTAAQMDAAHWHWDVSLYYARIRDEILSIDDPSAPGTSLSANIDRTLHAGLEALAGGSFPFGGGAHRIEPLVSVAYNAFFFDGDAVYGDNRLPAAPRYAVRGEAMYRHAGGFFAGPTLDLVGPRYADFGNGYRVGSYRLLGLRAGVDRGRWTVFGEVRNLLDEDCVGVLTVRDRAGIDDALLQAGEPRSAYVGVRVRF